MPVLCSFRCPSELRKALFKVRPEEVMQFSKKQNCLQGNHLQGNYAKRNRLQVNYSQGGNVDAGKQII